MKPPRVTGGIVQRSRAVLVRQMASVACACSVLCLHPAAAFADVVRHSDATCGYRLSYPADWTSKPGRDGSIVFDSPNALDTEVVLDGIWDTDAIGSYVGSSGLPRARGTMTEVLLDQDWNDSTKQLVWIDQFRNGAMSVTYLVQLQRTNDVPYYHLSLFLVDSGAARGLASGGWSYAVVGAWIPQARFHELEPLVMDVVRSLEFIKAEKPCWSRSSRFDNGL